MTTKPQLHPLLGIKNSRTRRKYRITENPTRELQEVSHLANNYLHFKRVINCSKQVLFKCSYKLGVWMCYYFKTNQNFSRLCALFLFAVIFNPLLNSVNASTTSNTNVSSSSSSSAEVFSPVIPTSVSKAYTHIPLIPVEKQNISRSSISRPFYTRMTPSDAKRKKDKAQNDNNQLKKPSKLFTSERDPLMSAGFDQTLFDSTTEKVVPPPSSITTRKSTFSPFLTQTDTGPKIRLEPFFNILSTFQSLALGSSKEQKFSPSYQAVAESVGVAEEQLKAKRNKGTKGLRNKNPGSVSELGKWHRNKKGGNKNKNKNKYGGGGGDIDDGGGPVHIPLPKPIVFPSREEGVPQFASIPHEEGDIITADSLQDGSHLHPMDVLSVSMSTSMSMGPGGGQGGIDALSTTPKSKHGTVEDVHLDNDNNNNGPPVSEPLQMQLESFSITEPSMGGFLPSAISPMQFSTKVKKSKKGKKSHRNTQQHQPQLSPTHENGTGPESRERRLRSESNIFENFHHTDSETDLLAEESFGVGGSSSSQGNMNANIPPGYALPTPYEQDVPKIRGEDVQMVSKYPISFAAFHPQNHPGNNPLPPPGLGLPPKSFFSLGGGGGGGGMPYPKRPSFHNYPHPDPHHYLHKPNIYGNLHNLQANQPQHSYNKPPEASSDLGEQQNAADSKLVTSATINPHQKIGVMDGFDLFFKQYKVLVWGGFFIVTSLALLCLIVYLYTNNPPTEVVTAKGLLSDWVTNPGPQVTNFLSSIIGENDKGGGNGRRKRKRYKMQKRTFRGKSEDSSGSKKDLLQ